MGHCRGVRRDAHHRASRTTASLRQPSRAGSGRRSRFIRARFAERLQHRIPHPPAPWTRSRTFGGGRTRGNNASMTCGGYPWVRGAPGARARSSPCRRGSPGNPLPPPRPGHAASRHPCFPRRERATPAAQHGFVPEDPVDRRVLRARPEKKRPAWGVFDLLAEREGFEPSIELLTLYSLSRGAPSASRASLRVLRAPPARYAARQAAPGRGG